MKDDQFHNESDKFNAIIGAVDCGITILDKEYNIVYQNHILKEMFGGIGRKCYRAYEGKKKKCSECHVEKTFSDGKSHSSMRSITLSSGLLQHWENIATPIRDDQGKITACLEIRKNITEQKKLEKLLLQSQKNWEDVFDTMTDSITIHDNDFNIISSNIAAKKLLKIILPVRNANDLKCFRHYHGTDRPPQECPSCGCLKTGKPSAVEFFEPHLNKHIEIRAIPRFDTNNKLIGLIHIVRDITQRKKVEMELSQSRDNLDRQKGDLEKTNAALRIILDQREADKTELEEKILMNVKMLIIPYIEKLKHDNCRDDELKYVSLLETGLKDIISAFSVKLSSKHIRLTPTEIMIASLIKDGFDSKEIAQTLTISFETINSHRQNIRKKFGLNKRKINLRSYLLSLAK